MSGFSVVGGRGILGNMATQQATVTGLEEFRELTNRLLTDGGCTPVEVERDTYRGQHRVSVRTYFGPGRWTKTATHETDPDRAEIAALAALLEEFDVDVRVHDPLTP